MADLPPDILASILRQDFALDAAVDRLMRRTTPLLARVAARTQAELMRRLEIVDGRIAQTPANQQVLRQTARIYEGFLKRSAYGTHLGRFVHSFPGQQRFFRDILSAINDTLVNPLPDFTYRVSDEAFFRSHQISSVAALESMPLRLASQARERLLLTTGALPVGQLADVLGTVFAHAPLHLEGLAVTAISTHYRVIQDKGYQIIEEEAGALKYIFAGPRDKLNRPFCRRILNDNEPRTREQINRLDNRSPLKPVFTAAGGYACRHQWIPLQ